MLDGMSDSIQRSRIENLHSREVDRQSPTTGLIFLFLSYICESCGRETARRIICNANDEIRMNKIKQGDYDENNFL